MIKKLFTLLLLAAAIPAAAKVNVSSLKLNHQNSPSGVSGAPVFSWVGESDVRSDSQTA